MVKKYSGIGSRSTPPNILKDMETFAFKAAKAGWILRSGGADGADTAFELGATAAGGTSEIYIPWKGFNKNPSVLYTSTQKAEDIASQFHPRWNFLRRPVKLLMARNVHQVLGLNCDDPVDFVICYTPDKCENGNKTSNETGGTGQALRIATFFNIPIYNLACRDFSTVQFLTNIT